MREKFTKHTTLLGAGQRARPNKQTVPIDKELLGDINKIGAGFTHFAQIVNKP